LTAIIALVILLMEVLGRTMSEVSKPNQFSASSSMYPSLRPDVACLVVFSGLAGVGKSTLAYALARRTGWAVLAKDQLDRTLERLNQAYPPTLSYRLMLDMADLNLRQGVSIILDAVFPQDGFRRDLAGMARRHSARFCPVECTCSQHELWQKRVDSRPEMVDGWTPADWQEVQRVRSYFQPSADPHLALDAVDDLAHNVIRLLQYVDAC
jgi:predicted kinase